MDFANEKGCRRKTAKAQNSVLCAFFLLVHYILRFSFKEASEIFYCDTLDSLLSLADKSGEDFVIAGCFGFGVYEELL